MPKKYRSAVTGEYVSKEFADLHPRQTVEERDEPAVEHRGWDKYISEEEYEARLDAITPKPSASDYEPRAQEEEE